MRHEAGVLPSHFMAGRRRAGGHILDPIPSNAGPRITTFRGGAVYSVRAPGSQKFVADNHFAAIMLSPSPRMTAGFASEKLQTYDAPAGMLVISPARAESSLTWTSTRENIALAISPENLLELAIQEFDRGYVDLPILPFGTIDPTALKLAELLKTELTRNEPPNELLVDSLITVFSIHLLRTHANLSIGATTRTRGGLSAVDARRVQDYLQENFSRKLAVAELSSLCSLSPGHFIQAFTKTFGEPPHKRLVNLRLDLAEKLLAETDITIAEIAYLSGFSSQSHLTSAMRRYRRVTPALVRLNR